MLTDTDMKNPALWSGVLGRRGNRFRVWSLLGVGLALAVAALAGGGGGAREGDRSGVEAVEVDGPGAVSGRAATGGGLAPATYFAPASAPNGATAVVPDTVDGEVIWPDPWDEIIAPAPGF